jgi:hypothetical protein
LNSGITDLPVIPVRAEPSDKSEMVSQLLFGEVFQIQETNKQWLRILTYPDSYDGWIDEKQVQSLSDKAFKDITTGNAVYALDIVSPAESESRKLHLLIGSSLPGFKIDSFTINDETFAFQGEVTDSQDQNLSVSIPDLASRFLNVPYMWGGRSFFGMDCSGFTQVVFKLAGVKLRRDTWQQSEDGIMVSFIDEARAGDLAFFHNEEGKITHTGIIIGPRKIIHASGRVRIDTIDHYGIFNEELNRYTHQLRLIKRMIG